jgi:hypothetical protein
MRIQNDAYYTPDKLASVLVSLLDVQPGDRCLEPHAGGGAFVRALRAQGAHVIGIDVDPLSVGLAMAHGFLVGDFLQITLPRKDWIVGNPPFAGFEAHVQHALDMRPRKGVAFLLRLAVLESAKCAAWWRLRMPSDVWPLAERPSFTGGKTDSCAYGWFVWLTEMAGQPTILHAPVSWR